MSKRMAQADGFARCAVRALWAGGIVASVGCGYYSVSGGLPSHVRTVGAEFFANQTTEPGLEEALSRALTDRLVGRSKFHYASSRVADAVVRGAIVESKEEPLTYTADQATSYQVTISVNAEVWDRVKVRTLWRRDTIRGQGTYEQTGGLNERDRAFSGALAEIAQQIVDGFMSGW